MKRIILIGCLLFSTMGIHAQSMSCAEAAANAVNVLTSAQTFLEQENIQAANTLIDSVKTSLGSCEDTASAVTDATDTTSETDATETQATEAPSLTLEPTSAPTQTPVPAPSLAIYDGNYTINAPTVTADDTIAFLHFAHTSIYSGSIDLYMDNEPTPIVSNLSYGEVTDAVWIRGGNRTVSARPAGSGVNGQILDSLTWNFASNSTWVAVAIEQNQPDFLIEPISIIRNSYNGQARVRAVNALGGSSTVTVQDASGRLYGNKLRWLSFGDTMIAEGTYPLTVLTNNDSSIHIQSEYTFATDTTTTLLVIGNNTSDYPIEILQIVDQQERTRVRFINTSASPVEIYQRPENILLVDVLDPGEETDFFTLASGASTFTSYALGTGPTGRQLANLSWQLRPGRDMVVSVQPSTMTINDISLTINSPQ